ncbi:MAG: hypothetical protein BJ554DRAFT_1951 [Olpidium bornovanus]|uniref:Transmembrane protein n=1 Tax=Olpidium bornovanus TaxID=278681 RepID=A0A8H8DGT5_9FUNG|nr:MAG: hypothetical protein BJ554DRAFT_1951 [Olpidium bornovanus]
MSAGVVRTSFAPRGLKHHTVRSISYMNDKEGATDPNDWVQHHLADGLDDVGWHGQRVEQQDRLTMRTLGGAVVIPGVRSAKLRTSRPAAENPPPTLSAKTKPPGSAGTTETITPVFYEFHYYGSDDDFLMKSSVRQYFKQNALEPADAVLFTISTGTTTTVPAGVDLEEHPALLGFQYAIDGPAGAEMTRFRLCSRWYVKVVVLLYIALAVVLVRFVVSDSYMYLFAFLLVFVLCFLMIFFVDILEQSRAVRNMVGSPAMESPSAVSE